MANTFLTEQVIAKAVLSLMRNEGVFVNRVNREFDKEFKGGTGDSAKVRKPVRFLLNDGRDITNKVQGIDEKYTDVTIDQWKNIAIGVNARELTFDIKDFARLYLRDVANTFIEHADYTLAGLYKQVHFATGTPGTLPTAFMDIANVGRIMDKHAMPRNKRMCVMNEDVQVYMADAMKGTFEPEMAKSTIRAGYLGKTIKLETFMDQNINRHTSGTCTGSPVIDTVSGVTYITATAQNTETSTLHTDGWTGTLLEGDIITIGTQGGVLGVHALNPANRMSTGVLQQFVVRANCTGAADSPLTVSPAIVTSGPYQNVDRAPADGWAVTVVTQAVQGTAITSVQNMAFHPNALTLASVPLAKLPDGGGVSMHTENYEGLAVTVTRFNEGMTLNSILRFDFLYGVKVTQPSMAVRWQA